MKFKLTINGREHELEYTEAERVFNELRRVFGNMPADWGTRRYFDTTPIPCTTPVSPFDPVNFPHVTC